MPAGADRTFQLQAVHAVERDLPAIAELHRLAADRLTEIYGPGPWSPHGSISVRALMPRRSVLLAARSGDRIVGSLRLVTKKPWAIDVSYFRPVRRPLYLIGLAVHPAWQGRGVGRFLLEAAREEAKAWPADAIRLDAWGAPAGVGGFYLRCGFTEVARASYRGVPHAYYELCL